MIEDVTRYFDQQAAGYGRAAGRGVWYWQRRREARAVLGLAGACAGRSVLDLGCGAGFYAKMFAGYGARPVFGVDASAAMVATLTGDDVIGICADAARVSLDRTFQIIVVAGLMEFVGDPAALLVNVRRHLATDGRAVLLVPPDNAAGALYRRFHRRHGFTVRLYGDGELGELATAAGLRVERHRYVPPYSHVSSMVVS